MSLKFFLSGFIFLCYAWVFGQYNVADIPDELRKNANAVIRKHDAKLIVHAIDKATYTETYAITILNEKATEQSYFYAAYNKFSTAKFVSGNVYDEEGILQSRVNKKEVKDYSVYSGSLYDDYRMLAYAPVIKSYPFTVEYTYEIGLSGILGLPEWMPVSIINLSLEKANYVVDAPLDYELRFVEMNVKDQAVITSSGTRKIYSWEFSDVLAVPSQSYARPLRDYLPAVYFAPIEFSYDNRVGNFRSWEEFSRWIYQLNAGRDVLPESTNNTILELVKDTDDIVEKARRIYSYMQSRTRYINIALGIGALQPFEARVVDQLGYGDCKALSNYTKSLLDIAGIESYYAVIRAGDNVKPVFNDIPSFQFNHAILCLPLENDTIWLECTSQHNPFGYLSDFTDNRYALLIKESGGELVKTKAYSEKENWRERAIRISILASGDAEVKMDNHYSGLISDNTQRALRFGPQERRKWITEYINLPGFQLNEFSFEPDLDIIPKVSTTYEFTVKNYANQTGRRFFVPLNQFSRWRTTLPTKPDIVRDIYLRNSFVMNDRFLFILPEDMRLEGIPEKTSIESVFGEYNSWVEITDDGPVYYRKLLIKGNTYPSDKYDELSEFFRRVAQADQAQMILTKD